MANKSHWKPTAITRSSPLPVLDVGPRAAITAARPSHTVQSLYQGCRKSFPARLAGATFPPRPPPEGKCRRPRRRGQGSETPITRMAEPGRRRMKLRGRSGGAATAMTNTPGDRGCIRRPVRWRFLTHFFCRHAGEENGRLQGTETPSGTEPVRTRERRNATCREGRKARRSFAAAAFLERSGGPCVWGGRSF